METRNETILCGRTMKKYFHIYKTLLALNWEVFIEYRASFYLKSISRLLYTAYHVLSIFLLTNIISSVFDWSRYELLLLASTYSVFIGLYHMIISHNMIRLSEEIYYGRLDFLLLKPIDSQFSATFWLFSFVDIIRVFVGALLTWFFLHVLGIKLTFLDIMLYVTTILMGLGILYSLWLSVLSLLIFNPRISNIIDLLFHLSEIGRYPGQMYQRVSVYLFAVVLPLTFLMIPATKVLLHKFTYLEGIELVLLCIIISITARFIWRRSLRSYTSASS